MAHAAGLARESSRGSSFLDAGSRGAGRDSFPTITAVTTTTSRDAVLPSHPSPLPPLSPSTAAPHNITRPQVVRERELYMLLELAGERRSAVQSGARAA